ncbi:MAG: hypothetical protein EOP06_04860 [Proteobacteria bacterium]|nr:MAG: hypothetical protein EOP06_04860 [Pseudomonadota bacterium]
MGVKQPVLTYALRFMPTKRRNLHSTWWMSGQYVNSNEKSRFHGCNSRQAMAVETGDDLRMSIIRLKLTAQNPRRIYYVITLKFDTLVPKIARSNCKAQVIQYRDRLTNFRSAAFRHN